MENKKRKKQIRTRSEWDWDLSEIVFGDPIAKQAARQSVQAANRKQALERYYQKSGRDVRRDYQVKYGPV